MNDRASPSLWRNSWAGGADPSAAASHNPEVTAPASPAPGLLAAIDIGSNSFRLEIGRVVSGRYRRVDYLKETVRLGAGLDDHSRLTEEAALRGLSCLEGFAQHLATFAGVKVRAVATQTLREASNRDEFLQRAQQVLGYPIEVISGREEARLIYAGVSHLQPSDERRLVVDIGGRSTELILGDGRQPIEAESFAVGSVSLSMRYFGDGRLTAEAFRAAQVAAGAEFEEALSTFSPTRWQQALGSSGTAGAVSQVLEQTGLTDGRISPRGLKALIERCLAAGHVDALDIPGLREDRRAVIPGGLAILYTLVTHFGIEAMWPARGALRQGVIVEMHERTLAARSGRGRDIRDETVVALQSRFGVDVAQARRVRAQALSLYESVCPDADPSAIRELAWACELHEIGMVVSHHDHHRHSAYLVSHLDAPGFSQSQQRRLGQLVLAQRGGLRKVEAFLTDEAAAWAVMCLRLAVIRHHARGGAEGPRMGLQREGPQALLKWGRSRTAPSPRTLYLLREEVQAWSRIAVPELLLPD
jgi:exopolyphosphatase/guanosine-5'-triphosphate,3'-diphosphate pyrophosphatase